MIIKFIKNHPAGIQKGTVQKADEKFAQRMIESNFAKKSTKKELDSYIKGIKDQEAERLKVLEEMRTEAKKLQQKAQQEAKAKEKDCGCGKVADCEECKDKK